MISNPIFEWVKVCFSLKGIHCHANGMPATLALKNTWMWTLGKWGQEKEDNKLEFNCA